VRVLLDACVPKGLRGRLSGHDVRTAPEMGWGDLDNGDLLAAMEGSFDALVTVDRRLPRDSGSMVGPSGSSCSAQGRIGSRISCLWSRSFSRRSRD
jgi:hypothetical protein